MSNVIPVTSLLNDLEKSSHIYNFAKIRNNLFYPSPMYSTNTGWTNTRNYISSRGFAKKKEKKKIWWRRTRQISNSGEEKLEGFLSLPLTVFLYLQRSEKKRAHTPRWTQGMKVVRVTYFPISLVCQRHQRVWRVAGILRTGRGAGWGRRTRRPGFKSVSM